MTERKKSYSEDDLRVFYKKMHSLGEIKTLIRSSYNLKERIRFFNDAMLFTLKRNLPDDTRHLDMLIELVKTLHKVDKKGGQDAYIRKNY
ncbi:MAG TPA: hypothetical protein ENI43_05580 [Firmicutes bacterium]|nr:hypothetical protein [Bacillota bacterium]